MTALDWLSTLTEQDAALLLGTWQAELAYLRKIAAPPADDLPDEPDPGPALKSSTARLSSTANDTISWAGTFCSFGLDTNYGVGAGTLAWDVDGGGYTNVDLSAEGVANNAIWNFERGAHTVTIKVISGAVRVNRFLAI